MSDENRRRKLGGYVHRDMLWEQKGNNAKLNDVLLELLKIARSDKVQALVSEGLRLNYENNELVNQQLSMRDD